MTQHYNGSKSKVIVNLTDRSEFVILHRIFALDRTQDVYQIDPHCLDLPTRAILSLYQERHSHAMILTLSGFFAMM